MITKKILAAAITSQPSANGVADAIDFDGATDYLSRSSDLVGNADSKTFTFSCWVYINQYDTGGCYIYTNFDAIFRFTISVHSTGAIRFSAYNSAGAQILLASSTAGPVIQRSTFTNILLSIDLTNTANRSLYVNDALVGMTYNTYTNAAIDFTLPNHVVGNDSGSGDNNLNGRVSHLFLDYTYRDLSVEANRRLFITADRKPTPKATLQALNPILYLPLDDPTQAGKNLGTGGDFTLNGVVARSGRGPNQFNAVYSDLDGAADYLSRSSALTGVSGGKQLTISFNFICDSVTNTPVLHMSNGSVGVLLLSATGNISCFSLAGSPIFNVQTGLSIVIGRNYYVVMSFDLTDTAKRFVYINGVQVSATYSSYNNINIPLASCSSITIGRQHIAGNNIDGRLGNVFFDTKYIDLSTPANLAKFVTGTGIDAKPVYLGANGEKPFGTPPLIYLPMYGNNAGKNYGTGGDFTVNSGPFAGSRGPNEFWGNKADFDGATGYLSRTSALAGVANGKVFSGSFYVSVDVDASARSIIAMSSGGSNDSGVQIYRNSANKLVISAFDAMTGQLLTATTSSLVNVAGGTFHIAYCFDLSNTAKRCVCVNGVLDTSVSYANYTNASISFANTAVIRVGASAYLPPSDYLDGRLSEFYLTTEYIDFSQEANRLKFRDAFGNPVDLRPQIAAGTLPNPAIYMRFDPSNFGKNSGTGGDFVVNGTITDGGQL